VFSSVGDEEVRKRLTVPSKVASAYRRAGCENTSGREIIREARRPQPRPHFAGAVGGLEDDMGDYLNVRGQGEFVDPEEVPTFANSPLAHSRKQSAIGASVRQDSAMLEHR
jgi:hypothetical protein